VHPGARRDVLPERPPTPSASHRRPLEGGVVERGARPVDGAGPGVRLLATGYETRPQLPCDFATKSAAQDEPTRWRRPRDEPVLASSAPGGAPRCYTTQAAAAEQQRATGQSRLLEIIRQRSSEERPVLEIVAAGSPQAASVQLTCQTTEQQATKECQARAGSERCVVSGPITGEYVHPDP